MGGEGCAVSKRCGVSEGSVRGSTLDGLVWDQSREAARGSITSGVKTTAAAGVFAAIWRPGLSTHARSEERERGWCTG